MQAVAGEDARWGDLEHLVAGVIDAIQIGNFYTYVAASDRRFSDKPIPPKAIVRPGDKPKRKKREQTQAQVDAALKAWRDGDLPMVEQKREVT